MVETARDVDSGTRSVSFLVFVNISPTYRFPRVVNSTDDFMTKRLFSSTPTTGRGCSCQRLVGVSCDGHRVGFVTGLPGRLVTRRRVFLRFASSRHCVAARVRRPSGRNFAYARWKRTRGVGRTGEGEGQESATAGPEETEGRRNGRGRHGEMPVDGL